MTKKELNSLVVGTPVVIVGWGGPDKKHHKPILTEVKAIDGEQIVTPGSKRDVRRSYKMVEICAASFQIAELTERNQRLRKHNGDLDRVKTDQGKEIKQLQHIIATGSEKIIKLRREKEAAVRETIQALEAKDQLEEKGKLVREDLRENRRYIDQLNGELKELKAKTLWERIFKWK